MQSNHFPAVFLTAVLLGAHGPVALGADSVDGAELLETFANYWTGSFSNERQAKAERLNREPDYPEAVRLVRDMRVHRLDMPAIGNVVLFLEEVKMDQPHLAHRQRVMSLVWRESSGEIEVEQLFTSLEQAYDRPPIALEEVNKLDREDLFLVSECNLFFRWEPDTERFKGGMRPQACRYEHPQSGPVYAEFDMVLDRHRLWYRDRSIKVVDGSIRGEIDGFSWLRFDRLAAEPLLGNGDRISRTELRRRAPLTAKMEGIWEGVFRRVDPEGKLIETLPSRIVVRLLPDGEVHDYHQVNLLNPDTDAEQRIESYGKWDVDRLRFFNDRLEGWAKAIADDKAGRTSVFLMEFKDGSGLTVSEVVSFNPGDPDVRMRATQYMRDGRIVRRTLIDEVRVSGPLPDDAQY
ncbi:CpcT/CpeT family chromophore lyase [Candidatus Foliamicus sp.]